MAIRTVVTRGFGNGSFNGTIALVVTRGYPLAALAPAITFTLTLEGLRAGSITIDGLRAGAMTVDGVAAAALSLDGLRAGALALDGKAAGAVTADALP